MVKLCIIGQWSLYPYTLMDNFHGTWTKGSGFEIHVVRPCVLRCASATAHHHTPKMDLSAIFSTPESGKINTQSDTKCTPTAHLNILS